MRQPANYIPVVGRIRFASGANAMLKPFAEFFGVADEAVPELVLPHHFSAGSDGLNRGCSNEVKMRKATHNVRRLPHCSDSEDKYDRRSAYLL